MTTRARNVGEMWRDSATGELHVWTGVGWSQVTSGTRWVEEVEPEPRHRLAKPKGSRVWRCRDCGIEGCDRELLEELDCVWRGERGNFKELIGEELERRRKAERERGVHENEWRRKLWRT